MFNTLPSPFLPINLDLVSAFHMADVMVPARKARLRFMAATNTAHDSAAIV